MRDFTRQLSINTLEITVQSIEGKTTEKRETTYDDCVGNGDEERKMPVSDVADVGELDQH